MDFSCLSKEEINSFLEKQKRSFNTEAEFLPMLAQDTRKTVQNLVKNYEKWLDKAKKEKERLQSLYSYETKLLEKGYKLIAGVDEAGRGPLAGPVVACAVILPENFFLPGLKDSKKVSPKKREELYQAIYEQGAAVGIGMAEVEEIDRINILKANYQAMERAVAMLNPSPDYILVDGNGSPKFNIPYLPIVGGDNLSLSIAAASIVAKVTRDRIMEDLDKLYPQYGFAQHKGYGTALHIKALAQWGPSAVHRLSFELVRQSEWKGR